MTPRDTTNNVTPCRRTAARRLNIALALVATVGVLGMSNAQAFPWYGTGVQGPPKIYGYSGAGVLAQGVGNDCSSGTCQSIGYNKTTGGDGRNVIQASDTWSGSTGYSATASGYADASTGMLGAWSTTHATADSNLGMYANSIMYNTYRADGPTAVHPNVTLNWSLDGNFAYIASQGEAILDIWVGMRPPPGDYSYNYGDLAGYSQVLFQTASSYTGYASNSSTTYSKHGTVDLTPILNYITNRYFGGKSFTAGDTFVLQAKLSTLSASPVYDPVTGATISMDNSTDFLHTASLNLSSTTGGVSISAVPAPASFWLYLTGLGGLLLAGRLRRRHA